MLFKASTGPVIVIVTFKVLLALAENLSFSYFVKISCRSKNVINGNCKIDILLKSNVKLVLMMI